VVYLIQCLNVVGISLISRVNNVLSKECSL